jgi:nitrite reductase (NADH) large subunit
MALPRLEPRAATSVEPAPVVVVGNGPAGIEFVRRLLARDAAARVVLYGEEPCAPYNRVALTELLTGRLGVAALANGLSPIERLRVEERYHCRVAEIALAARQVRDSAGRWQPYAQLVLATGSRPHVPAIEGIAAAGVYCLRDLKDAERLMARAARSRHTVVLGGGLLGIEAAYAMRRMNTRVTLVHHARHLMNRHLDGPSAQYPRDRLEAAGVAVVLGESIRRVIAHPRVMGAELSGGRLLDCDTVIVATGVAPAVELALQAGLPVGRGIRVDDTLRTADPNVYAIGECAEHRGVVHGVVAPGLAQASVAADNIAGGKATYDAAVASARLKVIGVPVASIGRVGEEESPSELTSVAYEDFSRRVRRRVALRRGRIVGAQGVGEWPELARIEEAVGVHRRVMPWQRWRFHRHGRLWSPPADDGVHAWPRSAIVCQCKGVDRGTLSAAADAPDCRTIEALSVRTGAGSVCGSCRPLLAAFVGASGDFAKLPGRRALGVATVCAIVLAIVLAAFPPIPVSATVQAVFRPELFWTEPFLKQITGFTLVGLVAAGLLVSARKRITRVSFGHFAWWRFGHALLGALALALLVAHTGLRLGENLNLILMATFLAASLTGASAGVVTLIERRPTRVTRFARSAAMSLHLYLLWPLPALLGYHILVSYYF